MIEFLEKAKKPYFWGIWGLFPHFSEKFDFFRFWWLRASNLMWNLRKVLSAVLEKTVLTDILTYRNGSLMPFSLEAGIQKSLISEEGGPSLQKQANNLTSLIICFLSNWYFFSLLSILRPLYFFIYFYLKNLLFYFINSRYLLHILASGEHLVLFILGV